MGDIETDDRPTPRHPFTLYQYRRHGCSLRSLDPICDLLGHVRRLRRSPLQDPTHAERRQAVDQWDRQMMDRDRRLTGFLRGQTDSVKAPAGFELSNPWRLEKAVL